MPETTITLKRKEAKRLKFVFTNEEDEAQDVSAGEFYFRIKSDKDVTQPVVEKFDVDFDRTEAGDGIVRLPLSEDDLNLSPGTYIGEIKSILSTSPSHIDKSEDITIIIEDSLFV
jgi:hypothetical protein